MPQFEIFRRDGSAMVGTMKEFARRGAPSNLVRLFCPCAGVAVEFRATGSLLRRGRRGSWRDGFAIAQGSPWNLARWILRRVGVAVEVGAMDLATRRGRRGIWPS